MESKATLNYKVCDASLLTAVSHCLDEKSNDPIHLSVAFHPLEMLPVQKIKQACPSLQLKKQFKQIDGYSLPAEEVIALSHLDCVKRLQASHKLKLY